MLSCDREKEPKTIGPARLLRGRRERPRPRAAEQRDERACASLHHLVGARDNCEPAPRQR
jgi:hypothetical protein